MTDAPALTEWLATAVAPEWRSPPAPAVDEARRRLDGVGDGDRGAIADGLRDRELLDAMPLEIQRRLQSDPIHQSDRLDAGRIYTITDIRLPGAAMDLVRRAMFDEPWAWWGCGRISGWRRASDASVRFVLWPAWLRSPSRVGIDLGPPAEETLPDGRRRVAADGVFFADFDGPGRYEVVEGSGTVRVRSIWNGVRRRNFLRLMPAALVCAIHVRAERGTLSFPFPSGTGFGGLARRLGVTL